MRDFRHPDWLTSLIEQRCVLALMGPTASGKSALSMALAEELPVELISVDSALIYEGMDIGTAKPSEQERTQVAHHLVDILPPTQSYSVSEFLEDASQSIAHIWANGRLPVLVGGTMMYFHALQNGLADLPEADPSLRRSLHQAWQKDPQGQHARLMVVDPAAAARIHVNDAQRLIRALEVYELTGTPLSVHQQNARNQACDAWKLVKVGLIPSDRKRLHQVIEQRFDQMLEAGFVKETEHLFAQPGLHADLPAIRSVGYRQAWAYWQGEIDYETFVAKAKTATRQLAKRQLTWLRKESDLLTLDPFEQSLSEQVAQTLAHLEQRCDA
ncbi:tRNA (adenosine(37)-N6)-dimethylallyltransferase MiaA [Thiomicrospira sp. WB1]|uniref:tRNA (adenosine(37)-N6)-dimethylallyltransferase MiaA n=1 Tax=Thiomicrospira sp. WB1 TaxID=1685380 RepID=UPI000AE8A30C|nr:tRNA (adenosine(37)-N6)-dimethylallyltransferase MiaA [Thiomicrospira sp. WB1]